MTYDNIMQLKRAELQNGEVLNYSIFVKRKSEGLILRWKAEI